MLDLTSLNKEQLEAVNTLKGNILVLAGAGTGKTRVLTYRIANLLQNNVNPNNIFAFTFTNKSANEVKERLIKLIGKIDNMQLSTFHSFCFNYLIDFARYIGYKERFQVIDEEDKIKLVRSIIKEHQLVIIDTNVINAISAVKNHTTYEYQNLKQSITINFIFHKYQQILKAYSKMDLDDLLYQFHKVLITQESITKFLQESCEYILIDEFQDTNKIQYEIINILAQIHNNIFLVGDQDQCIYTFRGSNIENINHFIEYKSAKVIKLEENYRSNKNILDVANSLIKSNINRIDKNLYTTNQVNNFQVIYANLDTSYEESMYTAKLIEKITKSGYTYNDIAILYRNNFLSTSFEKQLVKHKIPYQIFGSYPFFRHKEIKTLIYYYQFLFNPKDDIAFKEIINTPNRGIGKVILGRIEEFSKTQRISLFEATTKLLYLETKEFVQLMIYLLKEFKVLTPKNFIRILLEKTDYKDYILKEVDSKSRMNRLYDFIKMFDELDDNDNPDIVTIDFINQIQINNIKEENQAIVKLMTIHQAKGLEFKVVILAGCNEGILPSFNSTNTSIEEERRVCYVAITRAKERLYLLSANKRLVNGKFQYYKPSTFLDEIEYNNLLFDKISQ